MTTMYLSQSAPAGVYQSWFAQGVTNWASPRTTESPQASPDEQFKNALFAIGNSDRTDVTTLSNMGILQFFFAVLMAECHVWFAGIPALVPGLFILTSAGVGALVFFLRFWKPYNDTQARIMRRFMLAASMAGMIALFIGVTASIAASTSGFFLGG